MDPSWSPLAPPWNSLGALLEPQEGSKGSPKGLQEGSRRASRRLHDHVVVLGTSGAPLGALLESSLGPLGALQGLLKSFQGTPEETLSNSTSLWFFSSQFSPTVSFPLPHITPPSPRHPSPIPSFSPLPHPSIQPPSPHPSFAWFGEPLLCHPTLITSTRLGVVPGWAGGGTQSVKECSMGILS